MKELRLTIRIACLLALSSQIPLAVADPYLDQLEAETKKFSEATTPRNSAAEAFEQRLMAESRVAASTFRRLSPEGQEKIMAQDAAGVSLVELRVKIRQMYRRESAQ
jgi:hypothetical protein